MYRSPFRAASYQTTPFRKKGSWKCGYHTGVDRFCGSDPTLVAIGDGVIESVNACGSSYGNHVVLRIDGRYSVLYGHLKNIPNFTVGAKVSAGKIIGIMGNTGKSSGAHLHIEIQNGSRWAYAQNLIDPNAMIDWNNFGAVTTQTAEGDYMAKQWRNGSSKEFVFQTTADCKAQKSPIGTIAAWETATCRAVTSGCYLVEYLANGAYKAGYVKYHGGIK